MMKELTYNALSRLITANIDRHWLLAWIRSDAGQQHVEQVNNGMHPLCINRARTVALVRDRIAELRARTREAAGDLPDDLLCAVAGEEMTAEEAHEEVARRQAQAEEQERKELLQGQAREFRDDAMRLVHTYSRDVGLIEVPTVQSLAHAIEKGTSTLAEATKEWRRAWPRIRRQWQSWELQAKAGRFWQLDSKRLKRTGQANVKALNAVLKNATSFSEDFGLLLHGATGRGKTLAAIQGARAVIRAGYENRIRFVTAEDMKAVYSVPHTSSEAKKEFTAELLDVGLLIIDDIGLPTFSPAFAQRFASLIDDIYVAGHPVLWLTVQCDTKQMCLRWRESNPNMAELADRTVRRINELCEPMNFNG